MKVKKEVQIGLVVLFALGCSYMGLLYLKTSNLFHNAKVVYAYYTNSEGITPSTYIYAKGYNIGRVQKIEAVDELLSRFRFHISLNKDVRIPKDSYFNVKPNLIGGSSIILELGKMNTAFFEMGDTLPMVTGGIFTSSDDLNHRTTPDELMNKINLITDSIAVFIGNINHLITHSIEPHLGDVLFNTAQLTHNVAKITEELSYSNKSIRRTVHNIENFSEHLHQESEQIGGLVHNLSVFSEKLKDIPLHTWDTQITYTLDYIHKAVMQVSKASNHFSDTTNTAGLLLNTRAFYNNLNASAQSLHLLLADIKENPKRYINIQVFGNRKKKEKTSLKEDATNKNHQ